MEKIYKYRFSRRTIYWTLIYLVVFGLLGGLLYHLYEGGYLSAWFTSFIVALIALMSLSIPRYIVVTDEKVEVRCLLDITEIKRGEIASVRRVDPKRMKWFFPLFGGCGFFGYYGHFLDLRRFGAADAAHHGDGGDDTTTVACDHFAALPCNEDGQQIGQHRGDHAGQLFVGEPARFNEQSGEEAPCDECADVRHDHAAEGLSKAGNSVFHL